MAAASDDARHIAQSATSIATLIDKPKISTASLHEIYRKTGVKPQLDFDNVTFTNVSASSFSGDN